MNIEPVNSAMTYQAQTQTMKPVEKTTSADMDVMAATVEKPVDATTAVIKEAGEADGQGGQGAVIGAVDVLDLLAGTEEQKEHDGGEDGGTDQPKGIVLFGCVHWGTSVNLPWDPDRPRREPRRRVHAWMQAPRGRPDRRRRYGHQRRRAPPAC